MLRLPESLKRYGTTLKLVMRCENKAIYSQYYGDDLVGYEVVKIRILKSRFVKIFNRIEPERETYPSTGQWGIYGWTYMTLEKAIERYNQL